MIAHVSHMIPHIVHLLHKLLTYCTNENVSKYIITGRDGREGALSQRIHGATYLFKVSTDQNLGWSLTAICNRDTRYNLLLCL